MKRGTPPALANIQIQVHRSIAKIFLPSPSNDRFLQWKAWLELAEAIEWAVAEESIRVLCLENLGEIFCGGFDWTTLQMEWKSILPEEVGRRQEQLQSYFLKGLTPIHSIERCSKPVIAVVTGRCAGVGMELLVTCDLRYTLKNTSVAITEVDSGLIPMNRFKKLSGLIGEGQVKELAFTGRELPSIEAYHLGLFHQVFDSRQTLDKAVLKISQQLTTKAPLALHGIKEMLHHSQDHSVRDGLNYIATWNAGLLLSKAFIVNLMKGALYLLKKRVLGSSLKSRS